MLRSDSSDAIDPEMDYVRRQIRNLAEFARKLLGRARADQDAAALMAEVDARCEPLVGAVYQALDRLTVDTVINMVQDGARLLVYALACEARANIEQGAGNPTAVGHRDRARKLFQALLERPPEDAEARAGLTRLDSDPGMA